MKTYALAIGMMTFLCWGSITTRQAVIKDFSFSIQREHAYGVQVFGSKDAAQILASKIAAISADFDMDSYWEIFNAEASQ